MEASTALERSCKECNIVTMMCARQLKHHVFALTLAIRCGPSEVNYTNRKQNSNDCDYILKSFAGSELSDVFG
jgi:hypothetical protein